MVECDGEGILMSVTQKEKAVRFRTLHDGPGAFVIPNPWDVGSALILAGLGFQALATSSAASACVLGRKDHGLKREEALAHARSIISATDLPVSADLGNGFGDAPEIVGETIRLAADAGLVGCTIEDATGNQDNPLYDVGLAVERIAAAAEAARALPFPFILTARAHNFRRLRRCGRPGPRLWSRSYHTALHLCAEYYYSVRPWPWRGLFSVHGQPFP